MDELNKELAKFNHARNLRLKNLSEKPERSNCVIVHQYPFLRPKILLENRKLQFFFVRCPRLQTESSKKRRCRRSRL